MTEPRPVADLFLLPGDRRMAEDGSYPPEEARPRLPRGELAARLAAGANDRFRDLVIAGWQDDAVDLVRTDGVASRKRLVWLVRPGQVRAAVAVLSRPENVELKARLVMVPDRGTITVALEQVGLGWSLAVLDAELMPTSELMLVGINRFNRCRSGLERVQRDVASMLGRVERLERAIALPALRDLHPGCSAICLAGGPSLRDHLPLIRVLARDCVVVAVDVVQKRLQEEGIPVDYVITVDSHGEVVQRMAACRDPRTVLVVPVNGDVRLDGLFQHCSYFPAGGRIGVHLAGDQRFLTGTIVGTASVGLAYFLGCRDIALFGHDLAYGEVMYSDLVADGGGLDRFNRAQIDAYRHVPGNGGVEVKTDYWFEVAIDDFRFLIAALEGATVRNPNIGRKVGAVIPGAVDLPPDWQPTLAFRREGHDPARLPRLVPPIADRQACIDLLRGHHREFIRLWEESVQPAEITAELLPNVPECRFADLVVGQCTMAGVIASTRQLAMPPSLSVAAMLEDVRGFIDRCVAGSEQALEQVLTASGPLAELPTWTGFSCPDEAKWLHGVMAASLASPARPDLAMLLVIECSYLADLLRFGLCPELPVPRSATEGLLLLRQLMPRLGDAFLAGVLAMCRSEGVEEPLRWARERKVLPAGWHPDDAQAVEGTPPLVRACIDLRRLRQAGPAALGSAVVEDIARLPQMQVPLVRALVEPGAFADERRAALRRLIDGGMLALDDQMSAMILHHCEGEAAYRLVRQGGPSFGEAAILAMAQRLCHSEPERVLRYAQEYRPLSRFHDQMEGVAVQALIALGRHGQALDRCDGCWDGAVAHRLRIEALLAAGRLLEARALVAVAPDAEDLPVLAAKLLQAAMRSNDPGLLALCCRTVAGLGHRFAEMADLARSARTLLARLPSGVRPRATAAVPAPGPLDADQAARALDGLRHFLGRAWNDGVPLPLEQKLVSSGILDAIAVEAVVGEASRLLRVAPPVVPPPFDTAAELVRALRPG
jgi:hypothetical protein